MTLQDEFGFPTKPMHEWVKYFKEVVAQGGTNCWALPDEKIEDCVYRAHKGAAATGVSVTFLVHASACAYATVSKCMDVKL